MMLQMAQSVGRLVLAGRELTKLAGFTARLDEFGEVLEGRLLYCCFTVALLLLYCCLTAALLLLYCCFTAALLLLYCCFTPRRVWRGSQGSERVCICTFALSSAT
jgi:hypothetical protein